MVDLSIHPVDVVRVDLQAGAVAHDVAATEEPLEIRLGSRPFVVIMRTPGHDRHLAAGFLLSEQIVRAASDIASMRYCTDDDGRNAVNVLNVWLAGDAAVRAQVALEGRRHVTANSACGVCGRRSIDDLLEGYSEFGDFDLHEVRLIEPLRTLRIMHYAGWLARRWDDPAFPRAFPWFGEPRYWEQHVLNLREQVAAMQDDPFAG